MFKKEFKYYKSRCPLPSFEKVLDFQFGNLDDEVFRRQPRNNQQHNNIALGLKETSSWEMFEFKFKPGLIFILNPFTKKGQQYWVQRCLQDYTKKPNKLNLDPFNELQPGEDWWQATDNSHGERAHRLLQKLRWATLGYHHNWDTKEYNEKNHTEFPSDLAELSKAVVEALESSKSTTYQAEAAIINFYHFDSTLSGHKDVSEPNMESPLLSISFGQSAVFLVGGETLDDPVRAMFLRSGDIVVMSGLARKCYHGVPRIVQTSERPWADDNWESSRFGNYLDTSRINMNVRQVLLPDQKSIER